MVPAYRKGVKIPDRVRGRGSEECGSLSGKTCANREYEIYVNLENIDRAIYSSLIPSKKKMLKFLLAAKDVKKTENNSFVINHKSSPGSRVYKTSDPTTQAIQISL